MKSLDAYRTQYHDQKSAYTLNMHTILNILLNLKLLKNSSSAITVQLKNFPQTESMHQFSNRTNCQSVPFSMLKYHQQLSSLFYSPEKGWVWHKAQHNLTTKGNELLHTNYHLMSRLQGF